MRALALIVLLAGLSAPAWAQDAAAPAVDPAAIDATKLGVSLSRIQKGLKAADAKEKAPRDGLRFEFNIEVFGTSPRVEIFKGVDLFNGPVPGSAPTHGEFLQMITPQIYRTPALPDRKSVV